jgi:hypothetical protein
MNLLIEANLVNPPTESLALRFLTLVAKTNLHADILLQVEQEVKDFYYHYMKTFGLMDYVDDLIEPNKESGLILCSNVGDFKSYILTDKVTFRNVANLLGKIQGQLLSSF